MRDVPGGGVATDEGLEIVPGGEEVISPLDERFKMAVRDELILVTVDVEKLDLRLQELWAGTDVPLNYRPS